jgi:hypothetical protein
MTCEFANHPLAVKFLLRRVVKNVQANEILKQVLMIYQLVALHHGSIRPADRDMDVATALAPISSR